MATKSRWKILRRNVSTCSLTSRTSGVRFRCFPEERLQRGIERIAALVRKVDKSERLHPALRRPHRKQHLRLRVDRRLLDVKHKVHFQLFVERLFEMNYASRSR